MNKFMKLEKNPKTSKCRQEILKKFNMFAANVKISNRLNDYERLLQDTRHEIKPSATTRRSYCITNVEDLGTLTGAISRQLSFSVVKVLSSRQMDIKMGSDKNTPGISGCAFFPNGQVQYVLQL